MLKLFTWIPRQWQWLAFSFGISIIVLAGGLIFKAYFWHPTTSAQHHASTYVAPPKPATKPSPLTGIEVAPELADRPISAVVIENLNPDARPQSGLGQAGVVYEALAEGGITRFLAFFLDQRPPVLGPVRSLRAYFIDWALEFNAPVSHAGGSAEALGLVGPLGLKDINALALGGTFYRTSDRFAPHNLYTTSDLLDKLEASLGYNKPADFKVSPRQNDNPPATGVAPANPIIKINYSYNGYQAEYDYDQSRNDYARLLGGVPHIDRNGGAQIHVKNIVVEFMPTSYGTSGGKPSTIMATIGTGQVLVFRDGGVVKGTWSKTSHNARTQLLDADGKDIPLDRGNTWYSIVPVGNLVTY